MRRVVGEVNSEVLYSTPEDALATAEALGLGRYILAATFGTGSPSGTNMCGKAAIRIR